MVFRVSRVFAPYVKTGIIHLLKAFLFRLIGIFSLNSSLIFPYAAQSKVIVLDISHVWLSLSILISWPRYTYLFTVLTHIFPIFTGSQGIMFVIILIFCKSCRSLTSPRLLARRRISSAKRRWWSLSQSKMTVLRWLSPYALSAVF